MTRETEFSVVIPMYNAERWICRTVGSAYAQSKEALEIIVVDDGSSDSGAELVSKTFPEVKLLTQENAGPGAARNAGIEASRGKWVAFLDADDLWLPTHLEELSRLVEKYPDAGLVSTHVLQWRTGASVGKVEMRGRLSRVDYFGFGLADRHRVHTCGAAMRREVFDQVGPFVPRKYGQDLEYWARIALHHDVACSTARTALYARGTGGRGEQRTEARQKGEKAHVPVGESFAEKSLSTQTVYKALQSGDHSVPRRRLENYLDGRLVRSVYARLRRKDLKDIRKIPRLFIHRWSIRNLLVRGVLVLPLPLLSFMVRLRGNLKSFVQTGRWPAG